MSREYLYKAKRTDTGEWVQGYYVYFRNTENHCIYYEIRGITLVCDIDEKTLCQYTEVLDKNRKKIWENDKCVVRRPGVSAYGAIKYIEGSFCFVEDNTNTIIRLSDLKINNYEIGVVEE